MSLGAFAVLSYVARNGRESTKLEDLNGLAKQSPFLAGCLLVFMASLMGFPPTAGFLGKYFILMDAYRGGFLVLALAIAVNSVISLFYYLGILRAALVPPSDEAPVLFPKLNKGLQSACAICAVGVVAAFIFCQPILNLLNER